ncbi:MAG: putative cyclic nucleotide-binding Crp-type transcriptional regulator [Variovorax sp.]|nr:putative cyclic nucleotide-binding Crp-type transcriptional regulator [Variovorax sp.]
MDGYSRRVKSEPLALLGASCPTGCKNCGLRANSAFLSGSAAELDAIADFRQGTRVVEAGATIVPEHGTSSRLFTLYSGWAFRYKTLSDGRRQILNFLLPGDFIGLQDEFADGQTHGVEAATTCTLCVFPRDRLWQVLHSQPKLGYDLTWLAAREEKMVDDNLVTNGRRNAIERVAMLLMHLYRRAERVGMAHKGGIEFPFNQQHMADALGLSLVHTNKTLRRLRQLGLHSLEGGALCILNAAALESLGDYFERPLRPVPLI